MTFQAEIELKQRLRRLHGGLRKKTYREVSEERTRRENNRQSLNRVRAKQKPFVRNSEQTKLSL